MKYRNTTTGAIIDTEAILGGGWVPVTQPKPKATADDKPIKKETKRSK